MKVLHEEILDVVASDEFSSSLQQSGGACAQVGIQICSKIERSHPDSSETDQS